MRTSGARIAAALLFAMAFVGIVPPPADHVEAAPPPRAPFALPQPAAPAIMAPAATPAPAPAPEFVVKRVLPIDGPMQHGEWHWDDAGVPEGPLRINVDLSAQTVSVFRDGYEIGAAVVLYGATDKPTPLGRFPITQKKRHHISNLYGAPMPYMMRLTNDGVAIHASDVQWGSASHGCIGVPAPFAAKLFAVAKLGDVVVITDGRHLRPAA